MRRDNTGMCRKWRRPLGTAASGFVGEYIEAGADASSVKCTHECISVDDVCSGGVDQHRPLLHRRKRLLIDDSRGPGARRDVQRKKVNGSGKGGKRVEQLNVELVDVRSGFGRTPGTRQRLEVHAERPSPFGNAHADAAKPDDPKRGPLEALGSLPKPLLVPTTLVQCNHTL